MKNAGMPALAVVSNGLFFKCVSKLQSGAKCLNGIISLIRPRKRRRSSLQQNSLNNCENPMNTKTNTSKALVCIVCILAGCFILSFSCPRASAQTKQQLTKAEGKPDGAGKDEIEHADPDHVETIDPDHTGPLYWKDKDGNHHQLSNREAILYHILKEQKQLKKLLEREKGQKGLGDDDMKKKKQLCIMILGKMKAWKAFTGSPHLTESYQSLVSEIDEERQELKDNGEKMKADQKKEAEDMILGKVEVQEAVLVQEGKQKKSQTD